MRLFSRSFGPSSSARPLVLLHGLLGSSRNWLSTAADLAVERPLHCLDLRNHGQSPHHHDASYTAMVGDVLEWLEEQGLGQVHLLGHSMGGKVAMVLACQAPERVASLGIVDIAPRDYHSHSHRAEFAAMNELDLRTLSSRAEAELRLEARVADWAMRKFLVTNLERREGQSPPWGWSVNLAALTQALPALEANPLTAKDRYTGPMCCWRGALSTYVRDEDVASLPRSFPRGQTVTLEGCGHNPHMEARPAFVAAVRAFLAGVEVPLT